MKKALIIASLALVAAVACNKNAGEQGVVSEARVPVSLRSNLKGVHLTKSVGALDAWSGEETIHVFGLKRGAEGLDYENPFINDVTANSPTGVSGQLALLNPEAKIEEDPEYTEPFYYGDKKDDIYDFFGYYVDDAVEAESASLGEGGYYVHAIIDGTQDLMVACASRENDKGVSEDRVFSAYAARRGVQPNLFFKHKLSRFKFFLRSGNAIVHEKVTIAGISVESKTEADMLVAAPAADVAPLFNTDTPAFLKMDFSESPLAMPEFANPEETPVDLEVEGGLLVIPGDEIYKLKLQLVQEGATTEKGNERNLEIDFNKIIGGTENKFAEPGYQYNVTVVVYGLESVEVSVTLDQWKDGGSTFIDPDEDE